MDVECLGKSTKQHNNEAVSLEEIVTQLAKLHTGYLHGLHSDPEDGGSKFLRNPGELHRSAQRI
jgi:hypothetical protein